MGEAMEMAEERSAEGIDLSAEIEKMVRNNWNYLTFSSYSLSMSKKMSRIGRSRWAHDSDDHCLFTLKPIIEFLGKGWTEEERRQYLDRLDLADLPLFAESAEDLDPRLVEALVCLSFLFLFNNIFICSCKFNS